MTYPTNIQSSLSASLTRRSMLLMALVASAASLLVGIWGASAAHASFGFVPGASGFDGSFMNRDGSTDTRAGSHPYALTIGFQLNRTFNEGTPSPDGALKDLRVDLPVGFVGDPNATTKCTPEQLTRTESPESPAVTCPVSSQVGVAVLDLALSQGIHPVYTAVFNMVAPAGTPAVLGFDVDGVNVYIETAIRSGSDYGLSSILNNTPEGLPTVGSTLTLWGVPGDPGHDAQRCPALEELESASGECEQGSGSSFEPHESDIPLKPFLTLPTSCGGPLVTAASADSWQESGAFVQDSFLSRDGLGETYELEGCNRLGFTPTITTQPDTSAASTPSGLHVDLHFPQNDGPEGLAEAELKDAVVSLPAGMSVNPSSAAGLGACSPAQIELSGPNPAGCPESSKLGTVEVISPPIDHPLPGSVFLAEQNNNPFGSLLAFYIAISDPQTGVVVKVPAHVELDGQTGQLRTVVQNSPQLPFEDLKLDFFGGLRAPLVTPASCGTFTTSNDLTPWSSPYENDATPASSFTIGSGANGTGCAGGFAPQFSSGTVNNHAGAFSSFTTSFSRNDQDQDLSGVMLALPPGLSGILKGVERCEEPQVGLGTCGASSLIGHATATAGAGPDPLQVGGGHVFLTGPYKGAPLGLSIVVPAIAGPFNLGNVIVRAAVKVDPHTAQVTVISDPLPTILQGIPLDIRNVSVAIDRPGFMFNPTDCAPLSVTGTLSSTQGATVGVASHFQAANCAALPFGPKFAASTAGRTSKADGASLHVKLVPPREGPQAAGTDAGPSAQTEEANIARVKVELPEALPSQLKTLQKACTAAQFDTNPAGCPEASVVGSAIAHTPLLAGPLTGPAYFVSHGGEAFPQLIVVLQGEGITVDLIGDTFISKAGITSSTFASVPDVPVSSFELNLPQGKYSALAANGNLCAQKLAMPTEFVAQNGAKLLQSTPVSVEGCSATLAISSHSIKKRTLIVSVYAPGAGELTVSGKGLSSASKTAKGRETLKLTLKQRKTGRLSTRVRVSFSPATGKDRTKQNKSLTVKFAK